MDQQVSRINLLVWRLRARVKRLALMQNFIREDIDQYGRGGKEMRERFDGTRGYYLYLLDISLGQLREAITTSELDVPREYIEVEGIMKRVKPVSDKHLRRLVSEGKITQSDMDCIKVGKYTSVEEFFKDVNTTVDSFGLDTGTTSSDGPASTPSAKHLETYDENGFLISDGKDNQEDPKEEASTSQTKASLSQNGITPPVVLLPPSEPFSWADDEDDAELDTLGSPSSPDQQLSTSDPTPQEEDTHSSVVEEEETPSEVSACPSFDSDDSSSFDYDLEEYEGGIKQEEALERKEQDYTSESGDDSGIDTPLPAFLQAYQAYLRMHPGGDIPGALTESDDILDMWLEDHDMWYWQYEIIYAATLTALRYKKDFKEARDAYKADPFADE